MTKQPTQALAYMRYSSTNQQETSIEGQRAVIEEYCKGHNIIVRQWYTDRAKSAAKVNSNRPEYNHMMSDIEAGIYPQVKLVIFYRFDRLDRRSGQAIMTENHLMAKGINLVSVTEPFPIIREDGSIDPHALYFRRMGYLNNEKASFDTSDRTWATMRTIAKHHQFHMGGKPPYGYRIQLSDPEDYNSPKLLAVDPEEAQHVRFIYESVLEGHSYKWIADQLNERGAKPRRAAEFKISSLISILKNPKYIGVYEYGKRAMNRLTTGKVTYRDHFTRVEGAVPAIVSKDTWEAVNKMLKRRNRPRAKEQGDNTYLLTGYISCGKCGHSMSGSLSGGRRTYRCGNTSDRWAAGAAGVEITALGVLYDRYFKTLDAEDVYRIYKAQALNCDVENAEARSHVEEELRDVERKINNIVNQMADGFSSEALKQKLHSLEGAKTDLDNRAKSLEHKKGTKVASKSEIRAHIEWEKTAFHKWDVPALREILQAYLLKIELHKEKMTMYFTDGSQVEIPSYKLDNSTRGKISRHGIQPVFSEMLDTISPPSDTAKNESRWGYHFDTCHSNVLFMERWETRVYKRKKV
jgi:site-specific DNA recombinase